MIAVKRNAGVRFIRNDINQVAVSVMNMFQNTTETPQTFRRINNAGRVIGGTDDNRSGFGGDGLFYGVNVELKGIAVRPDLYRHTAMIIDIELVLNKIRRKNDDLFTRVKNGFEYHIQSSAGSTRHDDVIGRHSKAGVSGYFFRNSTPGFSISRIVHIAMHAPQRILCQFQQLAAERFGWLNVRVAKRKIINFVGAEFLTQALALFKHPADPG